MNSVNISLEKMNSDKNEAFRIIMETAEISQSTVLNAENIASVIAYHVNTITEIF
jgi:hypothetical protein